MVMRGKCVDRRLAISKFSRNGLYSNGYLDARFHSNDCLLISVVLSLMTSNGA